MGTLLIKNVLVHDTIQNIYINDNIIQHIDNEIRPADIEIDGSNQIALPTFANGHSHAAMSLFKGYGDDMPLMEWLQNKIWPAEAKLTEEDVYWGAKLACLEMIKTGTTLFNDMYWHFHGTARAVEEMGIRCILSSVFLDFDSESKAKEQKKEAMRLHEESKQYSNRITFALGPHALYTVSSSLLQWLRDYAKEYNLFIHFHLVETMQDEYYTMEKYNKRPIPFLEDIHFLNENLIACHGVYLEDDDLDTLQKYNVALVHNPCSNLKLAGGRFFRLQDIQKRNIRFCLGTDGCASNNNLDMLEEAKFASLMQKWLNNNPTVFSATQAWEALTKKGHEIFHINAGEIKEGKLADLMLVDLNDIAMTPHHNIISNMIYSANSNVINTVICNGKVLMKDKHVLGEEEIIAKANEVAYKITH